MGSITRGKALRGDLALYDGKTKTATRPDASGGTTSGLVVDNSVDVLQKFGNGTTQTDAAIAAAVAHIGSSSATLVFAPGAWTISASATIPANMTCVVPAGCIFSVDSGKTLTFSGLVNVEYPTLWTDGAGTVTVSTGGSHFGVYFKTTGEASATIVNYNLPPGHFERYGTNTTPGTTDMTTAIQAAFNSNEFVFCEPNKVYLTGTVTLSNSQRLTMNCYGATLKLKSSTNAALINHANLSDGTVSRFAVYNTVFDGNKAGQTGGAWIANGGCIFGYFDQLIVKDCEFKNSYGGSIFVKHLTNEFVCDGCYFHDGAEHTGTANEDSSYIAMQMSPTRTLTGLRSATITNFVMRGVVPGVTGRGVGGIIAASDSTLTSYQSHILKISNGTLLDCGQDAAGNVVAAIKLYRRCSQTIVDNVTVLGGQDNGIEVQGSDDVTVSNCTIRGLTESGQAAIKFGTRDGDKSCYNMSVLNCNISNCPRGIDAYFDDTLTGRDLQIIGGQIENVDQAIRVRKVAGEIKIIGTKIYNINDDAPTNLDHCIALGALSTDSTVTVDIIIDGVRVEDSENLIVNIRNITGKVSITNCHSKTIEDIRPINLITVTGDVLIANNNLAGVINDIISLDTVTGRIYILNNIAPVSATVRTTGGSAITLSRNNTWDQDLSGSATFNPASLLTTTGETTTVTVTGALLGDFAEASFSLDLQGLVLTAWVSAADTVSVRFQNGTAGTINLAEGTLKARVKRQ